MRRTRAIYWLLVLVSAGTLLVRGLKPVQAGGVVGGGTPQSCTELQLDAALQFGGLVTFNCGPAPFTLAVHEKAITTTTTIDGGGLVMLSGSDLNRVFSVTMGVTLTLDNLSVAHGHSSDFLTGGAILNVGTLILHNSQVLNSSCDSMCIAGGISNAGALQMYNSLVSGNQTQLGSGGIANITSQTVQIVNSIISDNQVTNNQSSGGGGLSNGRGTTLLLNSTVMSNTSVTHGGGIWNSAQGTLILVNSTISSNGTNLDGGGLKNEGVMQMYNATVTNNQADADYNGSGTGGGIYNSCTFSFRNSIVAANYDTLYDPFLMFYFSHNNDCFGTLLSFDYNIVKNYNTSACFINGGTFILNDPMVGPLQDNGGLTWTQALLPGSPAVNTGNPSGCVDNNAVTLTMDQRGFLRLARCDIGAFEFTVKTFLPVVRR